MKVTLDHDVFKWIVGLGVLGLHQVKHTGKVELDENMSKLFLNGIKFAEVLNKMFEAYNINMPNISDSMKNQVTPGVRLFNWNLLQETFQKINLPLDNDIKQLIVQGDIEMLNELLKDMLDFHEKHKPKPKTQQSIRSSEESFESLKKPPSRLASKLPQTKFEQQKQQQGELDLDNVDTKKQLNETQSLLDFLITGLSRHLQLKPQQAAALLSNGNKYLAHLLVKGVKGEFDTLINWLSEVYANLSRIYHFFEQQDANVALFLTTVKPGLLSKEQEITLWTLRIIGRVIFELSEMEMHQLGYEWFCNSGLAATFMCLQRHPQLVSQICELYSQVARYNMIDFFTVQFRKQLADKCVDMFNQLMDSLQAQKNLKDELINQGIIQYWAKEAMKQSDSDVLETKMTGLQYLSQNWMHFPIQFEEDQNYPTQFLFLMKKCTRDASNVLKFFSLNNLFRLLDKLATERNPYAAVLYKKLTFTLIENYTEVDVREFMLYNFMYLIQRYSSIPIDILIEPFVKQVLINDSQINLPDMVMFKFLANHPKMKLRLAIILLDLLSKIYLNNITMSHLAFGPIQLLMARYGESQLLQEYAFKLAKISLALHFGSLKSKKTQTRVNDLSILSVLQQHSNDHEILEAQKRAQIIELCKYIINLQQDELNEQIKPLLCHFYLELQNIRIKDKGIITLLNMFGNPESIVAVMKEQWDQEKEEQEEILRQSLIEENQMENEFTTQAIVDTPMTNKTKQSTPSDPFNELRQKEQDDEKQFLQQHGVGFKKRIVELERGKPNQNSKKGQVDPKVLENIANIKLKKEEEQLRKQQEEEEKKKKFEMLQKKAQQEIQKRTKQPEKQDDKKVELIDLDEHERMDVESMNMALKRNQKSVKYLFSKYSNSTNHASKKQYFNELQEQFEIIQFSDVLRLCRDFNINLPKDELQGMVKSINHKYGDNKIDQLDYNNFERFIIQISLRTEQSTFTRGPAGNCLDNMICNFGQQAKLKNENSIIFLDPDNLQLDPDRDQIKQLNLQLQSLPAQLLQTQEGHLQKCDELLQNNNFWKTCRSQPNKFKIITEKSFVQNYNYKPQTIIGLSQSWLHCNEIVNDLIMESFVSPVIEPQSELKLVTKVKTKLQNEPITKMRDLSQKRVTNKAIEDKMQKKQEEEQLKQEAEEKRKRHQEKLKQEYLRKKKEKEEEEQQKKQEERQQQIDKIEKEKRNQELLKKEAEDKKVKLREYKEKQLEENKIKEQQNVEQQKLKQEQDKKQRDDFQKKQKEEVKKVLEQKKNNFKEKEQQEKQKEIKQKEEMKEWKNNVEIMLKEEQEQRQREKQIQNKINELFNNPEVQNIFKSKEKQLQAVYHSYQEYTDWKIENTDSEKDLLQFKGFTNFASQFSIYPAIISPEDAQLIFRSLSRERERQQQILNEKNGFTAPLTKGMSYKEFEQALLRISIKGQKYFDLLADKYQKNMNQVEMIALKKENKNNAQIEEPLDKREDLYNLVDSSSSKTLLGLIYFMDMPEDKSELQSKLKALKLEYQKVAAQRDKKQTLQQKLGEDFPVPQPLKRNVSQKKEIKKDDRKKSINQKEEKTPVVNRQKSVNNRVPSAKSQIQSVNQSDLQKQSPKKMQAIGPNGEKEQWELNQDK